METKKDEIMVEVQTFLNHLNAVYGVGITQITATYIDLTDTSSPRTELILKDVELIMKEKLI